MQGAPVYYERIGLLDVKGIVSQIPEKDILDLHIYRMEQGERLRADMWRRTGRYPEEGCLIVQDCRGLSFKHMYTPAFPLLKKFTTMDADNYPEGLMRLYIVNAPSVFHLIWGVVKPWIDKRTLDKTQLVSGAFLDMLRLEVADSNLPQYLGGSCACAGGCVPDGGVFNSPAAYEQVTVPARDRHEHKVQVERHGALITWEFKTDANDIGFGVFHVRDGKVPPPPAAAVCVRA